MSKTISDKLLNMEKIIAYIKDNVKGYDNIGKYDGITIEFTCENLSNKDKIKLSVEKLNGIMQIKPFIFEDRKDDVRKFIIQFPDFIPQYTDDEITNMYIANFKWLLDDTVRNYPNVTRQYIIDHLTNFVKLAIKTYCRSNINRYRENEDDYLNNTHYRQKLNILFLTYLDEYWNKKLK